MSQAVVLMNGYVVYLNSITDHDTFNPETTPIIFDSYTGRVRQFTKGNITYMAVNDPKTDKFKHYVNATTFWNNATPINNSFQIESFSNYNSNVFKYSTIPFLLGVGQYGVGVDSGNGVAKGTKVILVREKIVFDSLGNASLKVDKKGFDFNQDKSCFQGDKTIKGNLCENENFDNIQHLTGYVEYPSVNILIGDDSLKKYAENIKNKKFKNEKTNEYYFIDADQKPIIDSINYLFFKISKNQPLINYLQQNGWYILFQKHFETINLFDSSSTLPGHAQRDYHKRYTERYFNLLYTRLVEFYFWSNAVRVNSLDKITVIIRLISLFTDLEISVLDYNAKIKLLEDILRNNLWVSGKWDALYSGTKLSEEEVVVKIIRAFYREENNQPKYTEIDNFLDYLASTPKYEVNNSSLLYQMLYKKIDDDILFGDTGQGAQGQYVRAVFDLWTFSKYNPSANNTNPQAHNALSYFTYTPYRAPARPLDQPIAAPAVINYESTNAAIWYIDNYDFNFENTLIKATERNAGVVVGSVVGYYHIYQPISLKQTDATDTIVRMPWLENTDNNNSSDNVQNGIPIFYLMYVDQAGDYSDAKATIGLAVDVFLTFTGIGEIKSIKYLTEVTSFRKYISGALQPVEKAQFLARISAAL
ncbi:hypothetical protein, partial [Chryseobacterium sp.]|uniref:hypothetical protein n=1 Tax=Chryseobacterium sp. TaxID=1871047 RepID=UPI0024E20C34